VALDLRRRGYRAYALAGGLAGWLEAGLPIEPKRAERGRALADICPECGQSLAAHVPDNTRTVRRAPSARERS
jgi:hypothetical protein